MRVVNNTNSTVFYDARNHSSHKSLANYLTPDSLSKASLANHIANCQHYAQHPNVYAPIIGELYPIPPKTTWDFSAKPPRLVHPAQKTRPFSAPITTSDFTKAIRKLAARFADQKFAVELSGGLDTSLIISLMRAADLNPVLIGLRSERYEFRTERVIQEAYLSLSVEGKVINYEEALPFSHLDKVPLHELPNKASLYYFGHQIIAKTAQEFGVKSVLNGIGIEPFLVEPISGGYNSYLAPLTMEDPWADEHIFRHYQCRYVNVAILKPIYHLLRNLRSGLSLDTQKNWSRKFFSEILPRELSEYSYKAGFDGIFQEALESEYQTITGILDCAYQITRNPSLRPSSICEKIEKASQLNYSDYNELMGKISFATWICALSREKLVN